jgi:hypothetical protein
MITDRYALRVFTDKNHFTKPWEENMCDQYFKQRSYGKEMIVTTVTMFDIIRSVTKSKLRKKYA